MHFMQAKVEWRWFSSNCTMYIEFQFNFMIGFYLPYTDPFPPQLAMFSLLHLIQSMTKRIIYKIKWIELFYFILFFILLYLKNKQKQCNFRQFKWKDRKLKLNYTYFFNYLKHIIHAQKQNHLFYIRQSLQSEQWLLDPYVLDSYKSITEILKFNSIES